MRSEVEELQYSLSERDDEIAAAKSETEGMKVELASKERSLQSSQEDEAESRRLQSQIEQLNQELSEKQEEIRRFSAQRGGSTGEIQELQRKIEKRGEAIRELQNEVSTIMMQRTARENEVSSLKEKLRKVEEELVRARELTTNASASAMATPPSVKDLEAALQHSLESEAKKSEGTSLDRLNEASESPREIATESHHAQSETEDDENIIYFDETSAGLTEKETRKVDEFARRIRRSNKLMVSVIGFAGAEGTADLTESLSARRADAVRERLLERGVPQSRIEVKSSGQDRKFSNWRARRAELITAPIAVAESVN
ncbi:MAG: OmpA family protein [Verrucomicrobiota bacterium]